MMNSYSKKLAAIVFTDIANFTSLSAFDEYKAYQLLEKQRSILKPIVKKYNGNWLKEMGDGLLLTFQSTQQAVKCAIEIQQTVKDIEDLNLRIGIHQGDVFVKDNDVFGDDVNITSRIEPFSAVGGVAVSDKVYRDISSDPEYDFVFFGTPRFKGVKQKVGVYGIISHDLPKVRRSDISAKLDKKYKKIVKVSVPLALVILASLFFAFKNQLIAGFRISLGVTDIINETNEKELDGLSGMLITALEQSQEISVLTRSRMFDILKQIGKADNSIINEKTGLEIAQKANLNAIIIPSIKKFGSLYSIDLKALNPKNDEYLFTLKEQGTGQENIPFIIDKLAKKNKNIA